MKKQKPTNSRIKKKKSKPSSKGKPNNRVNNNYDEDSTISTDSDEPVYETKNTFPLEKSGSSKTGKTIMASKGTRP